MKSNIFSKVRKYHKINAKNCRPWIGPDTSQLTPFKHTNTKTLKNICYRYNTIFANPSKVLLPTCIRQYHEKSTANANAGIHIAENAAIDVHSSEAMNNSSGRTIDSNSSNNNTVDTNSAVDIDTNNGAVDIDNNKSTVYYSNGNNSTVDNKSAVHDMNSAADSSSSNKSKKNKFVQKNKYIYIGSGQQLGTFIAYRQIKMWREYTIYKKRQKEYIIPDIPQPPTNFVHPMDLYPWYYRNQIMIKRIIYQIYISQPQLWLYYIKWYFINDIKYRKEQLETIVKQMERAGCAFLKFGQWSSMRPDMFPPDIILSLAKQRDNAPSHSLEETKKIIYEQFGMDINEQFEHFDPVPIASGSIAQVYHATLRDDIAKKSNFRDPKGILIHDVAVKVRHPKVLYETWLDIDIIFNLVRFSRTLTVPFNREKFTHLMQKQTDFRWEGHYLTRFTNNFCEESRDGYVQFPIVCNNLLRPAVLIESWAPGRSVDSIFTHVEKNFDIVTNNEYIKSSQINSLKPLVENLLHKNDFTTTTRVGIKSTTINDDNNTVLPTIQDIKNKQEELKNDITIAHEQICKEQKQYIKNIREKKFYTNDTNKINSKDIYSYIKNKINNIWKGYIYVENQIRDIQDIPHTGEIYGKKIRDGENVFNEQEIKELCIRLDKGIDDTSLFDYAQLLKKKQIAFTMFDLFLKMFLRDNLIHGDLHAGNVQYSQSNNSCTILDAGMTVTLDDNIIPEFGKFLFTVCTGNAKSLVERIVHFEINLPQNGPGSGKGKQYSIPGMKEIFLNDIQQVMDHFFNISSKNESFNLLSRPKNVSIGDVVGQVLFTMQRHGIILRGDIAASIMAMSVVEGLIRQLDPTLDIIFKSLPYFIKYKGFTSISSFNLDT